MTPAVGPQGPSSDAQFARRRWETAKAAQLCLAYRRFPLAAT